MSTSADILGDYNRVVAEVEPLLFIVRDSGLQRAGIEALGAFRDRADQARIAAMLSEDDDRANFLLALRCAARSLDSELSMYLLLKEEKPEEAWTALVVAQGELGAAARAHPSFHYLEAKAGRLREIERMLFPPQVFMSVGMVVRQQHCSICDASYEECDHVAGRPYRGRFCSVVIKEADLDHIAFVEEPADRLCRVTSFKVPGGIRNRMTWVVTPEPDGIDDPEAQRRATMTVPCTNDGRQQLEVLPIAELLNMPSSPAAEAVGKPRRGSARG